jgi:hypothetical protein
VKRLNTSAIKILVSVIDASECFSNFLSGMKLEVGPEFINAAPGQLEVRYTCF